MMINCKYVHIMFAHGIGFFIISQLGRLVHGREENILPVKYIIYLFPDISSESQKLAIYSVNYCLEEISFSWIFTIKQVKKLYNNKETYIFVTINKL